jgi:hypothetical protein
LTLFTCILFVKMSCTCHAWQPWEEKFIFSHNIPKTFNNYGINFIALNTSEEICPKQSKSTIRVIFTPSHYITIQQHSCDIALSTVVENSLLLWTDKKFCTLVIKIAETSCTDVQFSSRVGIIITIIAINHKKRNHWNLIPFIILS